MRALACLVVGACAGATDGPWHTTSNPDPDVEACTHAAVSPLLRMRIRDEDTATGATVYVSALAGSPDQLVAALRCHRAWLRATADPTHDDCPLALAGLRVDARRNGDRVRIDLAVTDPALVPELQRRLHAQVTVRERNAHDGE
jgi:hypothetical protein